MNIETWKWPLTIVVSVAILVIGGIAAGEASGALQPGGLDTIERWATAIAGFFGAPLVAILMRDANRNGVPDVLERGADS